MNTLLIKAARAYGMYSHLKANHQYGNAPYSKHLQAVADIAEEFSEACKLTDAETELAIAGAWMHDAIEDARVTYNDVVFHVSAEVADIAYAVTNEKGRTRDERANAHYYEGIRAHGLAVYLKGCDRLANVRNAGSMLDKYRKEMPNFFSQLVTVNTAGEILPSHRYYPLFLEIENRSLGRTQGGGFVWR